MLIRRSFVRPAKPNIALSAAWVSSRRAILPSDEARGMGAGQIRRESSPEAGLRTDRRDTAHPSRKRSGSACERSRISATRWSSRARRIRALKPGSYTRMGAAIRHVGPASRQQPHRLGLLLLLTDGKPNDIDHYEGRYAVEDTRMGIRETRRRESKCSASPSTSAHARISPTFRAGRRAIARVARLTSALPGDLPAARCMILR